MKFTDYGSVNLHIFMAASNRVRLDVRDTGLGIGRDQLATIFEPFEQLGAPERRAGGTGLGLDISREFVRAMGGEIHVESHIGQGSLFVEAENGRTGLEIAQRERPHLILTDIVMPKLDGLELTRRLRQLPDFATVPVIAMSASPSGSNRAMSVVAGVSAFLPKPVGLEALLTQVATLLALQWVHAPLPASTCADARYRTFAAQLNALARGYQWKAILQLVEGHLTVGPGP